MVLSIGEEVGTRMGREATGRDEEDNDKDKELEEVEE